MSYYSVYLVESQGNLRNHHAIFVENGADMAGEVFQVTGNIQTGMSYETKRTTEKPEESHTFVSKTKIGRVKVENLHLVDSVCRANPPPEKQFDGPKRIDKNKPLRRCQEWTSETIADLRAEGVLE
jgi:hypothetical protein